MNSKWWKAAGTRALKTMAQTFIATIGTSVVIEQVNWAVVFSASILAGILSLATSITGLPELDEHDIVRFDDDRSDGAPYYEEEEDE